MYIHQSLKNLSLIPQGTAWVKVKNMDELSVRYSTSQLHKLAELCGSHYSRRMDKGELVTRLWIQLYQLAKLMDQAREEGEPTSEPAARLYSISVPGEETAIPNSTSRFVPKGMQRVYVPFDVPESSLPTMGPQLELLVRQCLKLAREKVEFFTMKDVENFEFSTSDEKKHVWCFYLATLESLGVVARANKETINSYDGSPEKYIIHMVAKVGPTTLKVTPLKTKPTTHKENNMNNDTLTPDRPKREPKGPLLGYNVAGNEAPEGFKINEHGTAVLDALTAATNEEGFVGKDAIDVLREEAFEAVLHEAKPSKQKGTMIVSYWLAQLKNAGLIEEVRGPVPEKKTKPETGDFDNDGSLE